MKQLLYCGEILSIGNCIEDGMGVEGGTIVGIDYDAEEVHVFDGKEGWTMSEEYDNMGPYAFDHVDINCSIPASQLANNAIIQVVTVDNDKRLSLSKPLSVAAFKRDMQINDLSCYINNTTALVQTVIHQVVYSVIP